MVIKRMILSIYTLFVCFICLLFIGPGMYFGSCNIVRLTNTEFMISANYYEKHAPNDSGYCNLEKQERSIEEMKRESIAWKNKIAMEKHSARQNLFKDCIQVAIAAVILVFHVGIYKTFCA